MATISVANLKTIADRVAAQVNAMVSAFGDDTGDSGSIAESAQANVTTILGLSDEDQEYALLGPARVAVNKVLAANLYQNFKEVIRALDAHTGGLNDFLSTNDERLHHILGEVYPDLAPANLFPPVIDPVASFEATGATAGTFTAGTAVDTTAYGKTNMVVKVTSAGITTETTVTLTMVKIDGTTEDKEVILANTLSLNDEVDIGTHDTDMYVDVQAISITGGTSGDSFKVITEIERTVSLT